MRLIHPDSKVAKRMISSPAFQRRLRRPVTVDFHYDIPYLAGYSKNARVVFFDRHLRHILVYKGRVYDTTKYIKLHEVGEKAFIDLYKLPYAVAHHLVTWAIEYPAVVADGLPWDVYDKFLKSQIKEAYDARIKMVPKQLDLTPYKDEHQKILIKKMKKEEKPINKPLTQSSNKSSIVASTAKEAVVREAAEIPFTRIAGEEHNGN